MYRVGYYDQMDVFQVLCYHHNLLSVIDHLQQYAVDLSADANKRILTETITQQALARALYSKQDIMLPFYTHKSTRRPETHVRYFVTTSEFYHPRARFWNHRGLLDKQGNVIP